jgi:hypothetical protein
MPKFKLKRIAATTKAKIIESDDKTYILGVSPGTKYNSYDSHAETFLGGIFVAEDFIIENSVGNPKVNDQYEENGPKTRGPSGVIKNILQDGDFGVYFKAEPTNPSSYYDFYEEAYINNLHLVPIYEKPVEFDEDYYESLADPELLLSGIPFSYLGEAPMNITFFDFDTGTFYGDSFPLKNSLNQYFDTEYSEE